MSVPFFGDFTKKTKDFFKKNARDKYDINQVIEINQKLDNDIKLKAKIDNGDRVKTKFVATVKRDKNTIEVTENVNKGLSIKLTLPNLYRNFDVISEHSNSEVKVTAKYCNKERSYFNTKLVGLYNPDKDGSRVCRTTAQFAVGDEELNLSVGGEVVIEDKAKNNASERAMAPALKSYSLGFLYRPSPSSEYSVIYSPDTESVGMEYSLTCHKQCSDRCSLTAKADGKVDTKLTGFAPVISLAGGWSFGANYMQGFVNSNKEWGMLYKVKVSDSTAVDIGVSSYRNANGDANTKLGYKVSV